MRAFVVRGKKPASAISSHASRITGAYDCSVAAGSGCARQARGYSSSWRVPASRRHVVHGLAGHVPLRCREGANEAARLRSGHGFPVFSGGAERPVPFGRPPRLGRRRGRAPRLRSAAETTSRSQDFPARCVPRRAGGPGQRSADLGPAPPPRTPYRLRRRAARRACLPGHATDRRHDAEGAHSPGPGTRPRA